MITSSAFADEFSGYIYDQDGDRARYYYGEYHKSSDRTVADVYRDMADAYSKNTQQTYDDLKASYQLNELRRQTALLREIADK